MVAVGLMAAVTVWNGAADRLQLGEAGADTVAVVDGLDEDVVTASDVVALAQLGFEPAPDAADGQYEGATRIEFLHCPFRELAEAYPELVCNLHRGLCEGVVDQVGGGRVEEFATLYDPEPCHVTVSVGYAERGTRTTA